MALSKQEEVISFSVCPDRIQGIIDKEFMPLIGQRQNQSEEKLKAMNDHFERWAKRAAVVSKVLFKISKEAACMWEAHSANLQKREEQLLLQLSKIDEDHQRKIKKKEATLDKLVEKMRQESSEKTLDVLMRNTLYPLTEMKLGYISFFHQKEKMVKRYPGLVLEELNAYSMADTKELLKGFPLMSTGFVSEAYAIFTLIVDAEKPGGRTPVVGQRDADSQLLEDARDTFTTSQGNAYHLTSRGPQWPEEEHEVSSPEMELVAYSSSLLDELHKELRLAFFNHLEGWFHTALTKALNTVETQNEELKAELNQRLTLRKLRAKSVKNDVHNVRVAELAQHHADIKQHCDSVLLDLDQTVTHLENLKAEQSNRAADFQAEVHRMESGFFSATSSKILDDLVGGLHSRLDEQQTLIKTSHRQFREDMQSKLDSLREANDDFSKSFKLFSEGGNFAPEEVETYQKCLDEVAKQIDCTEEKLASELEKSENKRLETAKNFVQKFENKHQFLVQGLKLLESLKRVPPKTQIQIKTEEGMSSMQSKKLDNMLNELQRIIDAYAAPILDEGAMKPEDIISFVSSVTEELKKRGHYLDWPPDPPQKPSTKTTSFLTRRLVHQSRVLQGGKVLDMIQGLLRMSKENMNKDNVTQDGMSKDTVIMDGMTKDNVSKDGVGQEGTSKDSVIKDGISKDSMSQDGTSKDIVSQETRAEPADRGSTAGTAGVHLSVMISASQQEGVQSNSKLSASESTRKTWEDTTDSERVKTFPRPTQLSRTFLDFGSKPGDEDITTFKGSMARIFRKANDLKLQLTKEFNRKMCQIPQQQILQDRFETYVEKANQSLQVYYSQVLEYCCESQQEFWKQLQSFEERLAQLAELLVSHLGREHLRVLATESGRLRDQLRLALQNSKDSKDEHSRQLRMWLGYLDYERELEKLNAAEEERQQELTSTIDSFELEMQASMKQHGDEFVTELGSLTQNLLWQFDGLLTANEFHGRQPVETVTTLIRRKQAEGLDGNLHIGRRTWPGLRYLEPEGHMIPILQPHKSTASITAVKTTLGHCRAMEARDAAYQLYQRRYHEELVEIQEEIRTQRKQSQHWEQYWRDSLRTAKLLHTGEA
ncbi:coiled-coil domain-containing protein 180-like [Scleropages formosus]|uniref:coiled-coil domain-containing protein 180-like n=1 Tax=Scleropages formosus TaxID=113540 RepID=UPI0010FA7B0E|nr:coiled-coil domain-containing protein 180-like [Scleropages formosus]